MKSSVNTISYNVDYSIITYSTWVGTYLLAIAVDFIKLNINIIITSMLQRIGTRIGPDIL